VREVLTDEEEDHYQQMIVSINETIRVMKGGRQRDVTVGPTFITVERSLVT